MRIIGFRLSMDRLVWAGDSFESISAQSHLRLCLTPSAQTVHPHAKAVRFPGV